MDVGDENQQAREACPPCDDAELGGLLDGVDRVAASIGEPDHLRLRGLRLQQERREIRVREGRLDRAHDLAAGFLTTAVVSC